MYPKLIETTRQATAPPEAKPENLRKKAAKVRIGFVLSMLRLKELSRLLAHRLADGEPIDFDAAVTVAAFSIEALRGMPQRRGKHPGLDAESVNQWLRGVRIFATLEEIGDVIGPLDCRPDPKSPFRLNAAIAGHMIALTRAERTKLRITTMEAQDESTEARKARKAAEKREADRDRARLKRRAKAAKEGRITGGPTIGDRKPWVAEGVSRATWYRQKSRQNETKIETETPPSLTSNNKGPRQPSLTVVQVSPSIDNSSAPAKARRAKRPRIDAHNVADFSIPLSPEDFPDNSHTEADLSIPLSIEDFPDNVIDLASFRRDVRRACFARAAEILEEGRVMLREQSARLDREHAEREAGAAQARPAADREGAA